MTEEEKENILSIYIKLYGSPIPYTMELTDEWCGVLQKCIIEKRAWNDTDLGITSKLVKI